MAERQDPRVKLPPPSHLGIVVKDMDRAIEYYSSIFGWGPFQVGETDMERFIFQGRPGSGRFKGAYCKSGSMVIELFQALEGETPYTVFSEQKGEGVHHLGFQVDDLDRALADLAEDGIRPIFQGKFGQGSFAYLNSDRIGGIVFELMDFSPFS